MLRDRKKKLEIEKIYIRYKIEFKRSTKKTKDRQNKYGIQDRIQRDRNKKLEIDKKYMGYKIEFEKVSKKIKIDKLREQQNPSSEVEAHKTRREGRKWVEKHETRRDERK